ncbi:MAG: hypothetical protein WC526_00805 [Patescibacteria group bacterium]
MSRGSRGSGSRRSVKIRSSSTTLHHGSGRRREATLNGVHAAGATEHQHRFAKRVIALAKENRETTIAEGVRQMVIWAAVANKKAGRRAVFELLSKYIEGNFTEEEVKAFRIASSARKWEAFEGGNAIKQAGSKYHRLLFTPGEQREFRHLLHERPQRLAVRKIGGPLRRGLPNPRQQRTGRAASAVADQVTTGELPLFEPEQEHLICLNRWSPARQLTRDRQEVVVVHPPSTQDWVDPKRLANATKDVTDPGGPSSHLVDYEIDHRESVRGQVFRMYIAPSVYGDFLAANACMTSDERSHVEQRLRTSAPRDVVRRAPRSVIAMNVVVLASSGRLLAIKRSRSVRTSQNMWTIGPNETMVSPLAVSGYQEDLVHLAERCLNEEVGLMPSEHGPIQVSWFGYNLNGPLVHVVAHVRARLPESQIVERVEACQAVFEHGRLDWISTDRRSVFNLLANWRQDDSGRQWMNLAALALQEYWRMRTCISQE